MIFIYLFIYFKHLIICALYFIMHKKSDALSSYVGVGFSVISSRSALLAFVFVDHVVRIEGPDQGCIGQSLSIDIQNHVRHGKCS